MTRNTQTPQPDEQRSEGRPATASLPDAANPPAVPSPGSVQASPGTEQSDRPDPERDRATAILAPSADPRSWADQVEDEEAERERIKSRRKKNKADKKAAKRVAKLASQAEASRSKPAGPSTPTPRSRKRRGAPGTPETSSVDTPESSLTLPFSLPIRSPQQIQPGATGSYTPHEHSEKRARTDGAPTGPQLALVTAPASSLPNVNDTMHGRQVRPGKTGLTKSARTGKFGQELTHTYANGRSVCVLLPKEFRSTERGGQPVVTPHMLVDSVISAELPRPTGCSLVNDKHYVLSFDTVEKAQEAAYRPLKVVTPSGTHLCQTYIFQNEHIRVFICYKTYDATPAQIAFGIANAPAVKSQKLPFFLALHEYRGTRMDHAVAVFPRAPGFQSQDITISRGRAVPITLGFRAEKLQTQYCAICGGLRSAHPIYRCPNLNAVLAVPVDLGGSSLLRDPPEIDDA